MTITELTKKHGIYAEDENKNHSAVNIEFVNIYGDKDEVQLNTSRSALTNEGIKQLEDAFRALCPELYAKPTSVTCVSVVASADTEAELIALGY